MYLCIVKDSRFFESVVSLVPCIDNSGVLVIPVDCEQELKNNDIPYELKRIK